jgi:chromosome segregation ATPase
VIFQVELALSKGESTRWRTCANQLTEKASQANPEELRRLLQERENLQKQLQTEREAWNRDQEECRRLRASLAALEQQHEASVAEVAQQRSELERVAAENEQLSTSNKELLEKHKDLVSKELTVRRIAKKYKTQYDTLALEVKQKGMAQAEGLEKVLAEHQAAEQQLQAQIEALNQQITTLSSQVDTRAVFLQHAIFITFWKKFGKQGHSFLSTSYKLNQKIGFSCFYATNN